MSEGQLQDFDLVMIKPSHYDDDGYPIVWWRALIPSNSLAALHGVAVDCRERQVLGPGVKLNLFTFDETNCHIDAERIIRRIRRRGARALIALIGVQSNQFDRAVDIARPFRAAGLPVAIGGFHVSGCQAMLPETPAEIEAAMAMGIAIFTGECEEGRLDELLVDAWNGALKPRYDYLDKLPDLSDAPLPFLPKDRIKRTTGSWSSFDLGRGCPFQCSFCTIINVQGRKSRFRTADDLEALVRENVAQGIRSFFITDDNFARNKDWENFFDRLIKLREEENIQTKLIIQVDTLCHRIPNFVDKAARAGVIRVFIGLENINPDNLLAANKRQNKITEYRNMFQAWTDRGVITFAGYILGFPADTKEKILRDVAIIKRELPIDVLEFFFLTPLPGSEDHKKMLLAGEWMDPDLNKYDLNHRVSHHPVMSDAEWDDAYISAWRAYYTWDHIETVARRHAANPAGRPKRAVHYLTDFKMLFEIEKLHPLEGGAIRRKRRKDRRSTLAREPAITFHPRHALDTLVKLARYFLYYRKSASIVRRVRRDPDRLSYSDVATARCEDEYASLDLFKATGGGMASVEKQRRQDAMLVAARRSQPVN